VKPAHSPGGGQHLAKRHAIALGKPLEGQHRRPRQEPSRRSPTPRFIVRQFERDVGGLLSKWRTLDGNPSKSRPRIEVLALRARRRRHGAYAAGPGLSFSHGCRPKEQRGRRSRHCSPRQPRPRLLEQRQRPWVDRRRQRTRSAEAVCWRLLSESSLRNLGSGLGLAWVGGDRLG